MQEEHPARAGADDAHGWRLSLIICPKCERTATLSVNQSSTSVAAIEVADMISDVIVKSVPLCHQPRQTPPDDDLVTFTHQKNATLGSVLYVLRTIRTAD